MQLNKNNLNSESKYCCDENLNKKQEYAYKKSLERFDEWLLKKGKNPDLSKGYAESTVENDLKRINQLFHIHWETSDEVSLSLTPEIADQLVKSLVTNEIKKDNGDEYADASKRKMVDTLEKYFRWNACGDPSDAWTSEVRFIDGEYTSPDFFNREERKLLRNKVLEFRTIPKYGNLSPEQRNRWKTELAQRTGKKKENITPEFWEEYNTSYKFPSLIYVALDIGLRPCEVARARTSWYVPSNNQIRIPKEDSAKNEKEWVMFLKEETCDMLDLWLQEREARPKYDETDAMWLNRQGNPYQSRTLNPLLRNLCDEAGIPQHDRNLTWYSIRHSTGTYLANQTDNLKQVMLQLRHKTLDATLRYLHSTPEDRIRQIESLD